MKKVLIMMAVFSAVGFIRADIVPIASANVVGFIPVVATASSNTIVTIPFEACLGGGTSGMLADLVATNGLTSAANVGIAGEADQLVVLTTNGTDLVYYYYFLQIAQGWTAIEGASILTNGSSVTVTPPAATNFPVARGLGFWIKRVSSENATLYLKGQVSTSHQATTISEGWNLVGIGSTAAFTLNDSGINWTGAFGTNGISSTTDKILVCNNDGTFTTYYYYQKANATGYYATFVGKWVESTATGPVLASKTIPAGQGFWYNRRGSAAFTFRPDGL